MISGAVKAQCPILTVHLKQGQRDAVMALHQWFVVFKHTEQTLLFYYAFRLLHLLLLNL